MERRSIVYRHGSIIPIMAVMYGATAAATPVLNEIFQSRGQSYAEATSTSQVVVLIGGMSFLESIVELQGCGVPLSNITPTAILVFMPALIGRIVAGVFVQASKTGQEFNNVLPSSWASENAPGVATTRTDSSTRSVSTHPFSSHCSERECVSTSLTESRSCFYKRDVP